jgi:hypothetical protein
MMCCCLGEVEVARGGKKVVVEPEVECDGEAGEDGD